MDLDQIAEFLPQEGILELTYRSEKIGEKKVLSHSLSDCIISAFCLRQHETACARLGCQNDTAAISRKTRLRRGSEMSKALSHDINLRTKEHIVTALSILYSFDASHAKSIVESFSDDSKV